MSENLEQLRSEIADRKGLPGRLSHRLQGDSRQAVEADCDRMLAAMGERDKPQNPINDLFRRRREPAEPAEPPRSGGFDQGARQPVPPKPPSMSEIIREDLRRKKYGVG